MKKILGLSLVAAMALSTNTFAEETKLSVSSSAALTSNYIWRGISYTEGTTTAQMGIDLANLAGVSGLHLNLWGSGIQEGSEIDTILGYETSYGLDMGIINYHYTRDYIQNTFAGASYAEAYLAYARDNYGVSVWKELGYNGSAEYNGLTFIADLSVVGVDLSAGTRLDLDGADASYFGSIGTSWDCLLIPTYTMGATIAYNSGFADSQSLFGAVEGATFALTLSKDF